MNLTERQVSEIYKGLKQGEFLKDKLTKTETALDNCLSLRDDYKRQVQKQSELLREKDKNLILIDEQRATENTLKDSENEKLRAILEDTLKDAKKAKRRSFWNGLAIGGAAVGIAGIVTLIVLN